MIVICKPIGKERRPDYPSQLDLKDKNKWLPLNMRLNEFEIESIKNLANQHFGKDTQVFLFGSRAMNQQRGGDIDLFVRNSNGEQLTIRTKINFISDLILLIGEQKIDVVLENPVTKNSVFLKTIYQTAIQLC